MGIETAFRAMENSLTEVIGKWIDAQAESEMLESIDIFEKSNRTESKPMKILKGLNRTEANR